ncbi:MAG: hypothetical protein WAM14_06050 [Candidatus Nitrosopolaris sp.]
MKSNQHNYRSTVLDVDEDIAYEARPSKHERQYYVLNEIGAAFASDYKYILLEAGFGKSRVAIAVMQLKNRFIANA